jgi:hypothetical protein
MRDLSAAIFVDVPEDADAVRAYHDAGGRLAMSQEQLDAKDPRYWNRRVRRMIREPADLKATVQQLLERYQGVFDPATGRPLLTARTDQVHRALLQLIDSGSFCGAFALRAAGTQGERMGLGQLYVGDFVGSPATHPFTLVSLKGLLPPAMPELQTPSASSACTSPASPRRAACRATSRCAARRSWRATTTT